MVIVCATYILLPVRTVCGGTEPQSWLWTSLTLRMAEETYDYLFKILLIGDSDVGKAEILFRFTDDVLASYRPTSTIGIDFKVKTVELNGKKVKLQIWDTTGQERFHTITTNYFRGARGVLLVYDITQKSSFDNVPKWLREIREHASENVEIILLGNRCDMEDKRIISKENGEKMAEENGMKFFEVSAKSNINIEAAFMTLAGDILAKQPEGGPGDQGDASGSVKPDKEVEDPNAKRGCC